MKISLSKPDGWSDTDVLENAHNNNALAQRLYGEYFLHNEDYDSAKTWFEKASENGDPIASYHLGRMAHANGEMEKAVSLFKLQRHQAYSINDESYINEHVWLSGFALVGEHYFQAALPDLKRLIAGETDKKQEVISLLQKSIELGVATAAYNLAFLYLHDENNTEAKKYFDIAMQHTFNPCIGESLNDIRSAIHNHFAVMYLKNKLESRHAVTEACKHFHLALAYDPTNKDARDNLEKLYEQHPSLKDELLLSSSFTPLKYKNGTYGTAGDVFASNPMPLTPKIYLYPYPGAIALHATYSNVQTRSNFFNPLEPSSNFSGSIIRKLEVLTGKDTGWKFYTKAKTYLLEEGTKEELETLQSYLNSTNSCRAAVMKVKNTDKYVLKVTDIDIDVLCSLENPKSAHI